MKKILVTGSNGLLGQKLTEAVLSSQSFELVATSKGPDRFVHKEGYVYQSLDVTDKEAVFETLQKHRPDAVIHTAAMTSVDACHVDREGAWQLNVEAVAHLVNACEQLDIHLIHLSTDFVFDGLNGPYREEDEVCPVSYYGETKVAAEKLFEKANCKWSIVRTILVYGILKDMSRSNIILWAKGALEQAKPINVVNDQRRMPTWAEDLATGCLLIAAKEAKGTFHLSGKNDLSIAEIVGKVAEFWALDSNLVTEVSSDTLNQDAKRPKVTGFILDKASKELGYQPHSFDEGLVAVSKQLKLLEK